MIIYRPYRISLSSSLKESKEFKTESEMKKYIVDRYLGFVSLEDILIDGETNVDDERCGWHNIKYVCIKRNGEENYIEKYGCA